MKWLLWLSTSCVIFLSLGCPLSLPKHPEAMSTKSTAPSIEKAAASDQEKKPLFSKEMKEQLHFAASLERESLRLISRQNSLEPTTLFSVLSYAFEIASGTKRSAPRGIDCNRFLIEKGMGSELKVFKTCQKPNSLVATIHPRMDGVELAVIFKIKEWASVVGLSVTLTNPDVECQIQIKDKKLSGLNCDNWAYFLSASDASTTEIHLKTMTFQRDQQMQLKLVGGFYRDLIERKKIEITVPLQGKIKLIEKEIEVKDDFADKLKTSEEFRGEKEKEQSKENQEQIKNQENHQENHQEDDYQKWIKEGGQIQEQPVEVEQGQSSGGVPKQPSNRGR